MKIFTIFLFLFIATNALAQNPAIIKTVGSTQLEPESEGSLLKGVKPWNGKLFYQGKGSSTQCILVMTDGTAAGTVVIKDLGNVGAITAILPAQDFVYIPVLKAELVSTSPVVYNWTRQLWRTDGTPAGTVLLKAFDVTPNTAQSGIFVSDASSTVNYSIDGNLMYFGGYDAASGAELWKSDGTVAGTVRVKDIFPGTGNGNAYCFCKVGGTVCFFAQSSTINYQLWKTDGTENGTQVLTAINPSGTSIAEFYSGLYRGKMYFWANDGSTGAEVWYTDGTASGTQLLKETVAGNNATTGSGGMRTDLMFIQDDNYLYFPVERSKYLWRTDGTPEGTLQLNTTPLTGAAIAGASAKGNSIYWLENQSTLYKSNGTVAGTSMAKNNLTSAGQLFNYRNTGWFAGRAANNSDVEPWRSDGTAANTARALDLYPGVAFGTLYYSSNPIAYFELNRYLYFFASTPSGKHLFRYNGDMTFTGTVAGNRWRDSTNWASMITPGITDTAYIGAGLTANIDGAKAFAGTLVMNSGSTVNLVSATDSLFINNNLSGTSATGNGVVVLRNFDGDTVRIMTPFTGANVSAQGAVSLGSNLSINTNLNLTNNARVVLNNADLLLNSTASTINGDAANYIVTNGSGALSIAGIGSGGRSGNVLFPIGTTAFYNPLSLSNTGTADRFRARVMPGISNSYSGETPTGSSYTGNAVNATWFITEELPGGSNATIGLQWNAAQELPGFDRTQSRIGHYTGGGWQLGSAGNAAGTNPYNWQGSGYTSFSPFGVLNSNVVLPLYNLRLSVVKMATGNRCRWLVTGDDITEVVLERSENGRSFSLIHHAMTSATGVFDDADLSTQRYYRLKAKDAAGMVRYSAVVWISRALQGLITLYPTAFRNSFSIQNNGDEAELQLFNAAGVPVLRQKVQKGTTLVEAGALAPATYFYRVEAKGTMLASGKLVRL